MSSISFLVASLEFLYIVLCHPQRVTDLHYLFQIEFLLFIFLQPMAKAFKIMLNKSVNREYFRGNIPDFRGNAFIFLPSNMMLAVNLSFIVFIMLW